MKNIKVLVVLCLSMALIGCGTFTGIPSHGGGKRFAVEQELVAATARSVIKDIDLSQLKGKKTALLEELLCQTVSSPQS